MLGVGLALAGVVAACGTAQPSAGPLAGTISRNPASDAASSVPASPGPAASAGIGALDLGPAATVSAGPSRAPSPSRSAGVSTRPKSSSFWGDPVAVENFDGPLSAEWGKYDTPNGTPPRSGDQVSVSGGQLHLTGGLNSRVGKDVGAGVMFLRDLKYGRWEVRFRAQPGAGYAPVVLLWPKENADWPAAGEIDLAEITSPSRASFGSFLHHGAGNNIVGTDTRADFTKFHTLAVDWLPTRVTYYLDGKKVFNVTPGRIETGLPTESVMHLALQLDQGCDDYIPCRNSSTPAKVVMDVDWVKVYRAPV